MKNILFIFSFFICLQLQAQIYTVNPDITSTIAGTSSDAFGRLRVSNPTGLHDAQFTYDLQPLLFEQIATGTGASIAHDATNRNALMTFSSTPTGGKAYMQTYEYFRYQPGKSQLVFVTFNFREAVDHVTKFAGYGDDENGIIFQAVAGAPQMVVYTGTGAGTDTIPRSSWNIDPLDGTGASGITLDLTKTQILVIDFQALYVGRVRVGFDIGGDVVYVHEFNHANIEVESYIATANLPIRCGMFAYNTVSTTMDFICSAVISEGGQDETVGYTFSQSGSVTAGSGTRTHLLSIRPDTTFNSITNRSKLTLEGISLIVTGSNHVRWELCLGQAISGTTAFLEVNSTYSATDYNSAGTVSGNPAIVIASGYVAATNQVKSSLSEKIPFRYPITLDAAGLPRNLGTLSLVVTGIGGTSAVQADVEWKEIR